MKNLIENALKNSMSYEAYRNLIKNLLVENKSTTKNGDSMLVDYSLLNDKRMDRLDKKSVLTDNIITQLGTVNKKQTWLVLTEGWCGDAAQNLPAINKMANITDKIELKLILRDEHEELMNDFLTNGGKSIPKLIALDNDLNVLFTWGPRPSEAAKMVLDYKEKHGKLSPEFKKDLQVWYNKNKNASLMNDFVGLIEEID